MTHIPLNYITRITPISFILHSSHVFHASISSVYLAGDLRVQCREWVVEKNAVGATVHRTRDGDTLPLPPGQVVALVPDLRHVALLQVLGEIARHAGQRDG